MVKRSSYRKDITNDGKEQIAHNVRKAVDTVLELQRNSDDLIVIERRTAGGLPMALMMFDGLVSNQQVSDFLLRPITNLPSELNTAAKLLDYLQSNCLMAGEIKLTQTYEDLLALMMSGFAAILIEGAGQALALGYQGFATRGVSEPSGENNLRGSREGFSESIIQNLSLIRRRVKSTRLVVEGIRVGTVSRTAVKIIYLRGIASEQMVKKVKEQLQQVKINVLLDSGYLQPFFRNDSISFFPGTWVTERPDTLCAKLSEGRIAVMVDGTPFALIIPYLFIEHFQSADDYSHTSYFSSLVRLLKFAAFFLAVMLPGIYVAVISFHPELIPETLLPSFISSVNYTPMPVLWESVLVFLLYELLREAGLRLPQPVGHTIGVVGGIVIGDAAVESGIIGLPLVILIAVTAISSFVIPSLYEPITILRFAFIFTGGLWGLPGISLLLCMMLTDLCSIQTLGVPVTAPLSPLQWNSLRDMFVRRSWKQLQRSTLIVENVIGSQAEQNKQK